MRDSNDISNEQAKPGKIVEMRDVFVSNKRGNATYTKN